MVAKKYGGGLTKLQRERLTEEEDNHEDCQRRISVGEGDTRPATSHTSSRFVKNIEKSPVCPRSDYNVLLPLDTQCPTPRHLASLDSD